MSEQTRPQPPREIDRDDVLGELEHRFKEADPSHAIAWVLDELVELDILRYREPVDNPDRDVTGVVRRGPGGQIVAKGSRVGFPWANLSAPKGDDTYSNSAVIGWPVIGAVPGTPAAANDPLDFVRQLQAVQRRDGETDEAYIARLKREGLWQEPAVSGPAEAEKPLPDWERVSSAAPESVPLLCGARWDGVRSCEHEPNHDGKHGFFRSPDTGWFEWTSSREVV